MPKRKVARHKGQQGCNSSTIDRDDQRPKLFSFSKLRSPRWPAWLGCCSAVANMTKQKCEQWRCGSAPGRCRKRRAQRIRGIRHHAGAERRRQRGRRGLRAVAGYLRDVDAFELWLRCQLPVRKVSPKLILASLTLSKNCWRSLASSLPIVVAVEKSHR